MKLQINDFKYINDKYTNQLISYPDTCIPFEVK